MESDLKKDSAIPRLRDEGTSAAPCDVLVVDDEPVVLLAARRVLEAAGLRVAVASDASSALAHPAAATCRALLCDLMLPDRPGTEVVAELRARRPDLAVVLTTGLITAENLDRALDGAAVGLLLKPFDEAELLASIHGALAGSEVRAAAPATTAPAATAADPAGQFQEEPS